MTPSSCSFDCRDEAAAGEPIAQVLNESDNIFILILLLLQPPSTQVDGLECIHPRPAEFMATQAVQQANNFTEKEDNAIAIVVATVGTCSVQGCCSLCHALHALLKQVCHPSCLPAVPVPHPLRWSPCSYNFSLIVLENMLVRSATWYPNPAQLALPCVYPHQLLQGMLSCGVHLCV